MLTGFRTQHRQSSSPDIHAMHCRCKSRGSKDLPEDAQPMPDQELGAIQGP